MVSRVDFDSKSELWAQDKWKGKFDVKWIYVKDVPNSKLRHVTLPNNEGKPVTNSRDSQEVFFDQGTEVFNIIRSYKHKTTILDDVDLDFNNDYPNTTTTTTSTSPSSNQTTTSAKTHSYKQFKSQNNSITVASTSNTSQTPSVAAAVTSQSTKNKSTEPSIRKILTRHEQPSKQESNATENRSATMKTSSETEPVSVRS
jgi:hypothetical protein